MPGTETKLETGRVYRIEWQARDIGYGAEEGGGIYAFTGEVDEWGKYTLLPLDGSPPLYLFADEMGHIAGAFA